MAFAMVLKTNIQNNYMKNNETYLPTVVHFEQEINSSPASFSNPWQTKHSLLSSETLSILSRDDLLLPPEMYDSSTISQFVTVILISLKHCDYFPQVKPVGSYCNNTENQHTTLLLCMADTCTCSQYNVHSAWPSTGALPVFSHKANKQVMFKI